MILDTGRLFARLLQPFAIDVVCDIGSLNGADALCFRRSAPRATIIAFEANPDNYRAMAASQALRRAHIDLSFCALAATNGEATFYVVTPRGPEDLARRGMSSLYQRAHPAHRGAPVR
ncbi:MAG TPA: FkbM family methyltransferase, partial [Steroidobacteraceae bacterium]|nr:FkbM family methyltransferase [Steroidobacteraceae bacterium]